VTLEKEGWHTKPSCDLSENASQKCDQLTPVSTGLAPRFPAGEWTVGFLGKTPWPPLCLLYYLLRTSILKQVNKLCRSKMSDSWIEGSSGDIYKYLGPQGLTLSIDGFIQILLIGLRHLSTDNCQNRRQRWVSSGHRALWTLALGRKVRKTTRPEAVSAPCSGQGHLNFWGDLRTLILGAHLSTCRRA
jgi:hypothetical protein